MKQYGFVYLLGNRWMPNLYKIGCTERSPHLRAAQLSDSTGVPAPFDVLCYIEVTDQQQVERSMHEMFSLLRVSSGREFFHVEEVHLLIGAFWWHPKSLGFSGRRARELLMEQGDYTFPTCPNPWEKAEVEPEASAFDGITGDFPWETPATPTHGAPEQAADGDAEALG